MKVVESVQNAIRLLEKSSEDPIAASLSQIKFLDQLVEIGEEPDEIDYEVKKAIDLNSFLFFGWLFDHEATEAPEVFVQMVRGIFECVYFDTESRRRPTLASLSKRQLGEIIDLMDFSVSQEMWDSGINPYNGLILFFQYIQDIGYTGGKVAKYAKHIEELKKENDKAGDLKRKKRVVFN